jgi:hypothetical protein
VLRTPFKRIAVAGLGVALAGSTAAGGASRALDPVSITVNEGIVATDGANANPAANVSVGESVAGNDAVVVSPPTTVTVVEAISVADTVRIEFGPTAVSVQSFAARRTALGVRLTWRVANPVGTLGFNVYREQRRLVRLNRALIPASTQVRAYSWLDRVPRRQRVGTIRYRLQAVAVSGRRAWLGIATVAWGPRR